VAAADVLAFWFGDALTSPEALDRQHRRWFVRSEAFDREIVARFGALPDAAASGNLEDWRHDPQSALALVIVLDQLPRHLYRETPQAFAYDGHALEAATGAIVQGYDAMLHPVQAAFLYMPFEHAEDREMQRRSVRLFEALRARAGDSYERMVEGFLEYARRHQVVIDRFGRFPHRNSVLGRSSTSEELEYLAGGGERFGVSAQRLP
jgi:uncharacterized protein (DUF924 family)